VADRGNQRVSDWRAPACAHASTPLFREAIGRNARPHWGNAMYSAQTAPESEGKVTVIHRKNLRTRTRNRVFRSGVHAVGPCNCGTTLRSEKFFPPHFWGGGGLQHLGLIPRTSAQCRRRNPQAGHIMPRQIGIPAQHPCWSASAIEHLLERAVTSFSGHLPAPLAILAPGQSLAIG